MEILSLLWNHPFGVVGELSWWQYVLITIGLTHITIVSVTIYLHRYSAHRALEMHPVLKHFFRFWLWLTTGMNTRGWTATHRKHHACTDVLGDPHSPVLEGVGGILWNGTHYYKIGAADTEILEKYGKGTPDDWMERNLYSKWTFAGIVTMGFIDVALFGWIGWTILAIQMMWIPFFAAGVVNGLCHHFGYRRYETDDCSTNLIPWGIIIGGEELHNNHHSFPTSSKLSVGKFEIDIGWGYIRLFQMLGIAEPKRLPPEIAKDTVSLKTKLGDVEALNGAKPVIGSHFRKVLMGVWREAISSTQDAVTKEKLREIKPVLLPRQPLRMIPEALKSRLTEVLRSTDQLREVHGSGLELRKILSSDDLELVRQQIETWCDNARRSGIIALQNFAGELHGVLPAV
jgi:stearoyl-CoA desaturase (Delta-9 desaturase)